MRASDDLRPVRPQRTGTTYRVGLVGDGILCSLTPPMHEREAAHLGLDYRYEVMDLIEQGQGVDDLPEILGAAVEE